MIGEDLEAEQNLVSMSQKTNYIKDWNELRKMDNHVKLQKETIAEESEDEVHHAIVAKRPKELKKQVSEKYDLKKCEKKLEMIDQPDTPINKNLFRLKQSYSLPKLVTHEPKESLSSNIFKKKKPESIHSYRALQAEVMKHKLELFQRKNTYSQKDLHVRILNSKSRYMPRSVNLKLNEKPENYKKMKIVVNEQEIERIKQVIFKREKYYSVPQLISDMEALPLIKTLVR